MIKFKFISLPLLLISLCACGTGGDTSSSTTPSEISSSDSTTEIISSEEESSFEKHISEKNPMNEPLIHNQYYLNHIGDIYNTWKTYQGNGVTIAVIDVGFKYNHPDFYFEDGTSKVSKDSAYFETDTKTKKAKDPQVGTKYLSYPGDNPEAKGYNNDHGTFCAGVAAAGINGKGVIGIAPLAKLLLLRTDGRAPSIEAAFEYANKKGAKVITISIGSYSDYEGDLIPCGNIDLKQSFIDAVNTCRKNGTVVISAAGNGGKTESNRPTERTYPGSTEGVIGVGGLAANSSSSVWTGSSYNKADSTEVCKLFAPSEGMYGCCEYNSSKYDGGWKGTSFASPIIAGIAALYFEKNPNNSVEQFEKDLKACCHKFTPEGPSGVTKKNIAWGRVDVGKLLGNTSEEEVSIKTKNTGDLNAYVWNSITGAEAAKWPGTALSKTGSYYICKVDTSKYDSVIFNDGTTQTIDVYASSFSYGNIYNLDVDGGDPFVGQYISSN